MKNHLIKFSVLISVIALSSCKTVKYNTVENVKITQENFYLGQKPPGLIPEPFAPGLVTTGGWEYCVGFTPDLKEFYFLREVGENQEDKKMELVLIKNKDNEWQDSVVSPREGTPFISPDGKVMHIGKRYKERMQNGWWSETKKLAAPFDNLPIMRLTASSKGTYFFDEFKRDFTGDIRYSLLVNGKYEEPKLLSKSINMGKSFHPFIAPDEAYLIFDSKRDNGYGEADIYVSFRLDNGDWGTPINLGDKINTGASEQCASVSPDGKYLFFNRNMGSNNYENVDIFWVSTEVLERLRPE